MDACLFRSSFSGNMESCRFCTPSVRYGKVPGHALSMPWICLIVWPRLQVMGTSCSGPSARTTRRHGTRFGGRTGSGWPLGNPGILATDPG